MNDVVLNINLSSSIAHALELLSQKRDVSMTEVIHQALSHEKFFQDIYEEGEKVFIKNRNGDYKEILFDFVSKNKS